MGGDCVICGYEGVRCACDNVECDEVRVRSEEEVVGLCISTSAREKEQCRLHKEV